MIEKLKQSNHSAVRSSLRLDNLLVERKLIENIGEAKCVVYAGKVRVNGQVVAKPDRMIDRMARLEIESPKRFVSRGGIKLEHAISQFHLTFNGLTCLDIGSSTGGFTDCMLQYGARKVYAVDAGHGQLDWKLRNNNRVIILEETNARYLKPGDIPEPVQFATIDVSFISLTKILPAVKSIISIDAGIISLIKPQFEAQRAEVRKGGIVHDRAVHKRIIKGIRCFGTEDIGLSWIGICESPIKGPAGNTEFLAYWKKITHNK